MGHPPWRWSTPRRWGIPHPRLGYPPFKAGLGTPLPSKAGLEPPPHPRLDQVHPPSPSPRLDRDPPVQGCIGTPTPQMWTDWNYYLPHPSDAGGNNLDAISLSQCSWMRYFLHYVIRWRTKKNKLPLNHKNRPDTEKNYQRETDFTIRRSDMKLDAVMWLCNTQLRKKIRRRGNLSALLVSLVYLYVWQCVKKLSQDFLTTVVQNNN